MNGPDAALKRRTDECTVKIPQTDVTIGGSGFFVAHGKVLTCAHVVAKQGAAARVVTVEWQGKTLSGKATAVPDKRGTAELWPFPDLCVIELTDAPEDHPWVTLGELHGEENRAIYLCGFSMIYDTQVARFQGKSARLDEPQDVDGGRLWQVKDCEMPPGMSGGPVLDLRSGAVCAVAKTRRKADDDMGGWVIPASAIRAAFPAVWEENRQGSPQASHWRALRDELWHHTDPVTMKLTDEQLGRLDSAARELGLGRRDFNELWLRIAGQFAPDGAGPFRTMKDLATALADLPKPGTADELDPLVRLFEDLAVQQQAESIGTLRGYATRLAARNGQAEALDRYRATVGGSPPARQQPVVVIRLDRFGPNPAALLLTIWLFTDGSAAARQVQCDPGPHAEQDLEQVITAVLDREIPDLPGKPMIEFALPDHLLDRAVEKWTLEGIPLGEDYPVVVRFGERAGGSGPAWRSRAGDFHSGRLPSRGSLQWADIWVPCQDPRDKRRHNAAFQSNGGPPLVALTEWRGKPVPEAVEAARHAGTSVILWQHNPCPGADQPGSTEEHPPAGCRGSRFQDVLTDQLSAAELSRLPELIWQLRAGIAAGGDGTGRPEQDAAILWDDPVRVPWAGAPPNRPPAPSGAERP
jgi:hypothetical protein